MSGIIHSIGKVFSKIWDFIKPIVAVVAIAVAVYFTAGLALSAFPATAGFAAALPGFAANGVAGAGIFSSAAASVGLGGGLAAGAATDAAAIAATAGATAGATVAAGGTLSAAELALPVGQVAANTAAAGAIGAGGAAGAGLGGAAAAGGGLLAKIGGASLTDKLLLASVGTNLVSGLTAPTPAEIQAAKNGFYGAFYGMDKGGGKTAAPDLTVAQPSEMPRTFGALDASSLIPGVNMPASSQTPNMGSGANVGASQPNVAAASPNLGSTSPQTQTVATPSLVPPTIAPPSPKPITG